jgi:hypothetical protein
MWKQSLSPVFPAAHSSSKDSDKYSLVNEKPRRRILCVHVHNATHFHLTQLVNVQIAAPIYPNMQQLPQPSLIFGRIPE